MKFCRLIAVIEGFQMAWLADNELMAVYNLARKFLPYRL